MKHTIIVAGGKGLRMGADLPKQFIPVDGLPVLMHTLNTFHRYDAQMRLVLVLPVSHQPYWRQLCQQHAFQVPHTVVDGGATRFHSSLHGIQSLGRFSDTDLVAIHDGVRPFVSALTIDRCFEAAARTGAAIPVLPVIDTLRHIAPDGSGHNVQRSDYRVVQTPQTFRLGLLRQAFQQPYTDAFTDDASVVEAIGEKVAMVEGNRENIKLTTPYDLQMAEVLGKGKEMKSEK